MGGLFFANDPGRRDGSFHGKIARNPTDEQYDHGNAEKIYGVEFNGVRVDEESFGNAEDPEVDLQYVKGEAQEEAQEFVDWITSDAGQEAIAGYQLNGQQLFFPNAGGST